MFPVISGNHQKLRENRTILLLFTDGIGKIRQKKSRHRDRFLIGTDAGKIKAVSRKRPMLPRGPECFADIAGAPSDGGTAGYTRCGQSGHPAKEPRLYLRWCG